MGRPLRLLIGKPGLDGHSNGAEQIAVKGRDAGFEIVYEGIRLTPSQIARAAQEEGVHLIGLSVLSGSHLELVEDIHGELEKIGATDIPLIIGGIFSFLPVASAIEPEIFAELFTTAHGTDLAAVAEALGFAVTVVASGETFGLPATSGRQPDLVVVKTASADTVQAMADVRSAVALAFA